MSWGPKFNTFLKIYLTEWQNNAFEKDISFLVCKDHFIYVRIRTFP